MSGTGPSPRFSSVAAFARHAVRLRPLAPLEEAIHWIVVVGLLTVLGSTIGMLTARLLRREHLHWSWSAALLGLAAVVRPWLGAAAWTLAVAGIVAGSRGRRWHSEDLDAGADLARIASRRRDPADAVLRGIRSLVRGLASRRPCTASSRLEGRRAHERFELGRDAGGHPVSISMGCTAGGAHTLVVGATGSGKTVTQAAIVLEAIRRGMGAVVLDPKGDPAMRARTRSAAQAVGRRFIHWSPDGPSVYNPYARGSDSEIADKVLASERFTEPHYQRQAQRYLGHVVRALRAMDVEVSLQSLVEHLTPESLESLVRGLSEEQAWSTHAYLDSLTTRQQADLSGVRDRLAILAESDVGRWLRPEAGQPTRFELFDAIRSRAVVFFDLQADRRPLVAQMLSAAIVQDLQTAIATLQGRAVPTAVVIDEFSALGAENVVRLFARARSAGISLVLGTQELSDLRLPGQENLLERIMGNLSVLIAHRQVVPESAKLIASLGGTRGAWRTSRHSTGALTRTRVREEVLGADEITALGAGWAAVISLGEGGSARLARIHAPSGPA